MASSDSTAAATRVLLLGGGFGGLSVARVLDAFLAKEGNAQKMQVTIVEKSSAMTVGASHQFALAGRAEPSACKHPYSKLKFKHVKFQQAEISAIDFDKKLVSTKAGDSLPYDVLVSSLGGTQRPDLIPGLVGAVKDSVFNMCSLDSVLALKKALQGLKGTKGANVAVAVAGKPYKCPPAPYEYSFLLDSLLKEMGVDATVTLLTPDPKPVPMANPATIAALLKERGINYLPSHQVEKVVAQEEGKQEEGEGAKGGVELVFCGEGQKRVKASLLVFMPELRGPAVFQGSGLENKKGFLQSHWRTLKTQRPGVYAIGDNHASFLPFEKPGPKPTPKAGGFAFLQANTVARDIIANLGQIVEVKWDAEAGAKQGDEAAVAVCSAEVGQGQAAKISIDLYSHPLIKPSAKEFGVSEPSKENMEWKVEWWQTHVNSWFNTD